MARTKGDDVVLLYQVMERAWLIMALISSALSDHPVVKSNRSFRHCTDRAREALFKLHGQVESAMIGDGGSARDMSAIGARLRGRKTAEDDFGAKLLRLKGTIPESVPLGIDSEEPAGAGRGRSTRKPGRARPRRKK